MEEQERRIVELEKRVAWAEKERDDALAALRVAEDALSYELEADFDDIFDEYCSPEGYLCTTDELTYDYNTLEDRIERLERQMLEMWDRYPQYQQSEYQRAHESGPYFSGFGYREVK